MRPAYQENQYDTLFLVGQDAEALIHVSSIIGWYQEQAVQGTWKPTIVLDVGIRATAQFKKQ